MARDNRRILKGVQFLEGGTLRTYADGHEDDLEAVLTQEQHDRLMEQGAIAGDWQPKGQHVAFEAKTPEDEQRASRKLAQQNAELKRELARLRGQQAAPGAGGGEPPAPGGPQHTAGPAKTEPPLTPPGRAEGEQAAPHAAHPLPEGVPAHPGQSHATRPQIRRQGGKSDQ